MKITREDFGKEYDTLYRFISYHSQIDLVHQLNCNSILEVGHGNGLVSNHLRFIGYDVTTYDIRKSV